MRGQSKPARRLSAGFCTFIQCDREVQRVQVLVRDNNVDQALKALKKKMQREGIFREMKLRGHYEKPSEKKAREKAEAIRRARKLARKRMQREGLLPMKPKVVPGAGGPGRPPRPPRPPM
jgi:small subunit ribosomal protein S21